MQNDEKFLWLGTLRTRLTKKYRGSQSPTGVVTTLQCKVKDTEYLRRPEVLNFYVRHPSSVPRSGGRDEQTQRNRKLKQFTSSVTQNDRIELFRFLKTDKRNPYLLPDKRNSMEFGRGGGGGGTIRTFKDKLPDESTP